MEIACNQTFFPKNMASENRIETLEKNHIKNCIAYIMKIICDFCTGQIQTRLEGVFVFRLRFTSDFFNLQLLVRFHQAGIVIEMSFLFLQVPALQTIMLFSQSLDTNSQCTRIVADEWIEVTIADETSATNVVVSTLQLRNAWEQLLKRRLEANQHELGISKSNLHYT